MCETFRLARACSCPDREAPWFGLKLFLSLLGLKTVACRSSFSLKRSISSFRYSSKTSVSTSVDFLNYSVFT